MRASPHPGRDDACARCAAPLGPHSRFCPRCGEPVAEVRNEREAVHRLKARALHGATSAVALGFVLSLLVVILAGLLSPEDGPGAIVAAVLGQAAMVGVALIAAGRLGPGARAECFPLARAGRSLAWAPAIGIAGLAIAVAYTRTLHGLLAGNDAIAPTDPPSPTATWAFAVGTLLAPVAEEMLDRGVMWAALARLAPPRTVLLLTSALFALQHGLNGGWLLEMPHRFAGGLLLGALRQRSGSLLPCILAHATWNAGALVLG